MAKIPRFGSPNSLLANHREVSKFRLDWAKMSYYWRFFFRGEMMALVYDLRFNQLRTFLKVTRDAIMISNMMMVHCPRMYYATRQTFPDRLCPTRWTGRCHGSYRTPTDAPHEHRVFKLSGWWSLSSRIHCRRTGPTWMLAYQLWPLNGKLNLFREVSKLLPRVGALYRGCHWPENCMEYGFYVIKTNEKWN